MMKILLTTISLFIYLTGNGQPLPVPQFMSELIRLHSSGELRSGTTSLQMSSIGEYMMAMKYQSVQKQWGMDTVEIDPNQLDFIDPEAFLRDYLKDQRIVIISEAHQKPQHRIFARKLLGLLYEKIQF